MEDFERSAPRGPAPAPEVPGYDVGRLLGRGGTASVWLATERVTRRDVALKCLHAAGPPEEQRRERRRAVDAEEVVRREVRILSALDHEHLVKAHAVVRVGYGAGGGSGLALVLDYAAGGSLAGLVAARGCLTPGEAVTTLTPIAQAVAYLHANGFTHGDVAPGNVLFTAHGKPLLADLGVARMVADPRDASGAGTDGFRDPSPVDAVRAGLQPERDVYSVAALGWFCLTGRAPEPEDQRPPLPLLVPAVPPELAEALEAGLRSDRRGRPSAAELADAVFRSAPAAPVDLSVAVHPTVLPQLLTRRSLPAGAQERRAARLRGWWGRLAPKGRSARHAPIRVRRRPVAVGAVAVGGGGRPLVAGAGGVCRRPGLRRSGFRVASIRGAVAVLMMTVVFTAAGVFGTLLLAGRLAVGEWAPEVRPLSGTAAGPAEGKAAGTHPGAVPAELQELLAAPRPEDAVRGLAGLRSYALSSGNIGLLERVNVPESPAADADAGVAARLAASGHVLDGFETRLSLVKRQPESTAARAVLSLVVATPPYRERDAAGTVVARAVAVPQQRLRLVLAPVDGRWRIQEILPAGG